MFFDLIEVIVKYGTILFEYYSFSNFENKSMFFAFISTILSGIKLIIHIVLLIMIIQEFETLFLFFFSFFETAV